MSLQIRTTKAHSISDDLLHEHELHIIVIAVVFIDFRYLHSIQMNKNKKRFDVLTLFFFLSRNVVVNVAQKLINVRLFLLSFILIYIHNIC